MKRREFLQLSVLGMTCVFSRRLVASQDRPNVLFIALDDMNDWISSLGGYSGKVHTPNLDRLGRKGITFTNAHSPSTVCNPSRTAIMTGLRPSTTGIYNNGQWWRPALPDVVTIPECFRKNGYHVEGGGKIFHHTLGNNPPAIWDNYQPQVQDDAWHYDYPVRGQHVPKEGVNWPDGFPLNGIEAVKRGKKPPANYREFDWGPFDKPDRAMGDGQMVQWAVDFLGRAQDRPFFLAAGIYRPHLPWYVPRRYFDLYPLEQIRLPEVRNNDLNDVPAAGRKLAQARCADFELIKKTGKYKEAIQAYLASISFADSLVGLLLDALEKSAYRDNTTIVVWSDHGWHLGEKGAWHKRTLWERATRVPFFVVAPGVTQPGSVCHRPVNLIDVYPTLVDLCGLKVNAKFDGMSLVRLLKNSQAAWGIPSMTTCERGNHAIRSERWRYIRYQDGTEELYDCRSDPHEWTNLAGDSRFKPVKQALAKWLPKRDATPAPSKSAYHFNPES
ncbi:MAG: sulfatase, partial [Phycisphaerales bacterium]